MIFCLEPSLKLNKLQWLLQQTHKIATEETND